MDYNLIILISIVFGIVEIAERTGLKRKYAHLLALPLGILLSYLAFEGIPIYQHIFFGAVVGICAVGTCDTICNGRKIVRAIRRAVRRKKKRK
ncbi:MAG: hypothetical protein ACOZCL_13195 [Bacillota bacterium]